MITRGLLYSGGLFSWASTPIAPAETELLSGVADMKIYAEACGAYSIQPGLVVFGAGTAGRPARKARLHGMQQSTGAPSIGRGLVAGRRGKADFTLVDENGMWIPVSLHCEMSSSGAFSRGVSEASKQARRAS